MLDECRGESGQQVAEKVHFLCRSAQSTSYAILRS